MSSNNRKRSIFRVGNQGYTESGIYGIREAWSYGIMDLWIHGARDLWRHGNRELGMFEAGADFGGDSDEDLDDAGAVGLDGVGLLGG